MFDLGGAESCLFRFGLCYVDVDVIHIVFISRLWGAFSAHLPCQGVWGGSVLLQPSSAGAAESDEGEVCRI